MYQPGQYTPVGRRLSGFSVRGEPQVWELACLRPLRA
jgi:hypothetical protein